MNELTAMVLRLAFFALLWIFIFSIAGVLRTDMFGQRRKSKRQRARAMRAAQRSRGGMNASANDYPAPAMAGAAAAGAGASAPPAGSGAGYAPAPQRPHELVVVSGPRTGEVVALGTGAVTIGRAEDNVLVIDDDFASGHHARIFPQGGIWYVEDAGSTNGTFLGDERVRGAVPLAVGAPVTVGHSIVELRS
ncbi:FHA domain-containing protein [Brevibacterium sp. 5221]|uniref:FHA domain-containing protein n=1 Tax=Brevibacterium rongguiense TaxID=2695267 RepID=A0A6N9H9Q2_9MICO|nr:MULTISPECIES: FHA domain-containing protein [Brevibacterium]MYM20561.1 FHA domain-containing protein [Brevibacterium rongguiense]WAL39663.1 FHA domain-containing protein [Brevibacterium sp. BRM-1]